MDFGTEQKPLCGICGCDCPEQACNWSENGTLYIDVICAKCYKKYEYDDEYDCYELKMTLKNVITLDGCGCSVVRDSRKHDEAICDDNGENWMCRNCCDNVEDVDSPNIFPYKKCSLCEERMSCGKYDDDWNWFCERCHIEREENTCEDCYEEESVSQ